ncbi:hypothetical protein [Bradyrhizobium stylosanthis]|nr:hypothetical protein [Bradyrhizobium stylosanthis]
MASCDEGAKMMPARLTAATGPGPLQGAVQGAVQLVSAVIGPDLRGSSSDAPTRPVNCDWIAALCLTAAVALLLVVAGHAAGRRAYDVTPLLFWSGVVLLVVPISLRIGWPGVARGERLFLLFLFAELLLYYKTVYSPTSFVGHDEFLHWVAADDLLTARRLFLSNSLLPIGPTYPALEILTTAIVNLTGLSVFLAGTLLLVILKGTFVVALFLFYEAITGSPRISAIACLAYMGCMTFVIFDSMFSYESLGVVLCMLTFAVEAASRDFDPRARLRALGLIALLLACLAVTHHVTAAFAAFYFAMLAAFEALRRQGASRIGTTLAIILIAALAAALPVLWVMARGNPLSGYLGPAVESGLRALMRKFSGGVTHRPEVSAISQPLGMRLTTAIAVLLLSLGLATGFFRSLALAASSGAPSGWRPIGDILKRRWRDSRIVFLTILAFGFPVSVILRLTQSAWEIANRMATFVFISVGLVVAVSIVHFWQGREARGWRRAGPAVALSIIVMGGITSSAPDPIRGRYKVGADQQSVEAMGIDTARWTNEWLAAGNRFTADRVNRLLLASYGRQDARVRIVAGVDTARLFEAETLDPDILRVLARSDIDFLLVDLRLSTAPPMLGFYFEPWQPAHGKALSGSDLLKFNDIKGVSRIYDNGWIVIYDVRGLHENS